MALVTFPINSNENQMINANMKFALVVPLLIGAAYSPTAAAQSGVIESDQFFIQIIKDFDYVWDDRGSGAKRDVTILRPKAPAGFFTVGHVAVPRYQIEGRRTPFTVVIKPKPGFERLLAAPTRFEWVYDDAGTGADRDLAIYAAECPSGFVALGAISTPGGTDNPSDPSFRCVSRSVVMRAQWDQTSIWDDAGSGGDHDVGLWRTTYKGPRTPNSFVMLSNGFWPNKDGTPDINDAWAFSFSFNNMKNPFGDLPKDVVSQIDRPKLTGPRWEGGSGKHTISRKYEVPFFVVDDPMYDYVEQWLNSPTYTINRTVSYVLVDDYDNTGCAVRGTEADEFSVSMEVGIEKESNWSASFGSSVSASVGVELSLKPIGIGGSATASVTAEYSSSFGFGGASTTINSRTITKTHKVPKGTYAALFQRKSTYEVFRADGTKVEGGATSYGDENHVFEGWSPPGWNANNPCGTAFAGGFPLQGGTAVVRGQRYTSNSGAHYMEFQADGNLAVYDAAGSYVWGLNAVIGDKYKEIKTVVMQSDGNLVARGDGDAFIWSAFSVVQPSGTRLDLAPNGALQIVHPDGKIAWSSIP